MGFVEQVVGCDRELGRSRQIAERLAGQLIQAASRLRAVAAPIGVEPPARVFLAGRAGARPSGARSCCAFLLAGEFGASQPRPDRRSSGPATLLETAVVVEPCLTVARRRDRASWPLADGDDKTDRPADGLRATETRAFADMPGDGAQEAERGPARGTPQLATQAIWSSTSPTTPPEERVPERTGDARALIDTAPSGHGR